MSTFVEVHCDEQVASNCVELGADYPQGWTIGQAKTAARKGGWRLMRGNHAICPRCVGALK
jgi:hypothetical protein